MARYLGLFQALDIQPPIFCLVSLLGVRGFYTPTENIVGFGTPAPPIGRDVLLLPDVVFEDYRTQVSEVLRPVFDTLWQAVGYQGCPYYDNDGNFIGPLAKG